MKTIQLTQGFVATVDDEDFERLSKFSWRASVRKGLVYARRNINRKDCRKTIYMHHDIVEQHEEFQVDHRDGNGLNNTRSNLRIATRSENQMNRGAMRNNKLGIKGVSFVKARGTYQSQITLYGKDYHLGTFKTAEEARAAYESAALEFHGEFARFNKVMDKPKPKLDLLPSAADRWTTCMASPRFCLENAELLPKDTSSRFSKEGNTAHEVAAAYLQNREPDPANCPTPITEDMRWHGWNYMEYVENLRTGGTGITKLLVESKMPLWYYEGRNAVVDAAVINPESLHIVDYKYGEGIIVSPERNLQATIYARQIAGPMELPLEFPITLHIYQPRSRTAGDTPYHFWETTWGEIKAISDEIQDVAQVIQINYRVQGMPLNFVASEKACQWCPAKGFCPERQKQLLDGIEALEVIEEKPRNLPSAAALTPEQIALVLKNKSQIEKWLKDVEGYAEEQMAAGNTIPGYKLVLSRGGNRYWSDPKKAVELLTKNTILKRSELVEEKVIGPAAVEKLLGKNKFPADVMDLIAKPSGNPVIATADDPREPYLLRAEDEFEVLGGEQ